MLDSFETLCGLPGVSGNETPVSDYITKKLSEIKSVDYKKDRLGNILVHKVGEKRAKTRLMVSAHMDEVGLMLMTADDEGLFKFTAVGGIDPRVVIGRRVKIGKDAVLGVIGTKAVHQQKSDERKSAPDFDALTLDIGAASKEEALKYVSAGDTAVFDSDFVRFGSGFIKSKAIDDRVGCAILLDILSKPLLYDIEAAFTVQEEVGLRGAGAAAYTIAPQASLVLEATTAADVPFSPDEKKICFLGKGPVLSFMDTRTVYDRGLYDLAAKVAEKDNIPCQPKLGAVGGNDAGAIHLSRGGVKALALSLPCRYLHSPSCVINSLDAENSLALAVELCGRIAASGLC